MYTVSHSFSFECFWTPIYFTCICSRKPTFFLWLLLQFSGQWPVAWLHTDRVLHTVRKRKEQREEIASTQFCSNIKRQTSDDKLCSQHTVKNGRLKIFGLCLPEDKPWHYCVFGEFSFLSRVAQNSLVPCLILQNYWILTRSCFPSSLRRTVSNVCWM